MLIQETERDMKTSLASKQKGTTPEQRTRIFHGMMLRSGLKSAVKYALDTGVGSVLMPGDIANEETGDSVAEVLASKHPEARTPDVHHLPTYSETPDFVFNDITTFRRNQNAIIKNRFKNG
jgi:hypothetical protein